MTALTVTAISCFALCSCAVALSAEGSCPLTMSEFVKDWSQSKQLTLEVAKAMPAEFYTFKPTSEEMTFGEQMLHIAGSNVYRFHEITGAKEPFDLNTAPKAAADKETVVKMLGQSFDYVIALLPQITPQQLQRTWHIASFQGRPDINARDMIMNMFVHIAHHRGQAEVYLRLKGITPPTYTF